MHNDNHDWSNNMNDHNKRGSTATSRTIGGFSTVETFSCWDSTGSSEMLHGSSWGISSGTSHIPFDFPLTNSMGASDAEAGASGAEAGASCAGVGSSGNFDGVFLLLDKLVSCSCFRLDINSLKTAIDISLLLTWFKLSASEYWLTEIHQKIEG